MCVFVCVCDTSVLMEEEKQVERDIGLNHEGGAFRKTSQAH